MTLWNIHLEPYVKTQQDIDSLVSLAKIPAKKEDVIGGLHEQVIQYMAHTRGLANNADYEIKRMLHQYPINQEDGSAWTPHSSATTLAAYAAPVAAFIAAVLRTKNKHPCQYKFPLNQSQEGLVWRLYVALENKTDERMALIHKVLYSLVGIPAPGASMAKWKCPLMCWLAVSSLREDGRFVLAKDYTPIIAKWEYALRNLHLYEAWSPIALSRRVQILNTLHTSSVRYQCSQYLADGRPSPWNSLRAHQRYASSLVIRQASAPNITWATDMSSVNCLGRNLEIARLRTGLQKLVQSVKNRMHALCNGNDIPVKVPSDLCENLTDNRVGHSWLSTGSFTDSSQPLLKVLFEHPSYSLADVDDSGTFRWHYGGLSALRKDLADLSEELAVLCFMTPAPPPRGTEFVDTRLSNSQIPRNIYKNYGTWFIHQRTKTSALTESLSWTPTLCPEPRITDTYMGIGLSLQYWRHIAVSLMREFIPPSNMADNFGDKSMNHNTNMARRVYAREVGHLAFLTTDAMLEARRFCEPWHNVLGLGKLPCPVALRVLDYGTGTGANPAPNIPLGAGLTTVICRTVTSTMNANFATLQVHLEDLVRASVMQGLAAQQHSSNAQSHTPRPNQLHQRQTERRHQSLSYTPEQRHSPITEDHFLEPMDIDGLPNHPVASTSNLGPIDFHHNNLPGTSHEPTQLVGTPIDEVPMISHTNALRELRKALKNNAAEFTSESQYQLIAYSLSRDRNIIGVLPTGGGKSACYEVPAIIHPGRLSIVFVPFVAVIHDQLRRAAASGTKAAKFVATIPPADDLQLLFVSWEHCGHASLVSFMNKEKTRIHRVVVDEAHQILTSHEFRPQLKNIDKLRKIALPKIYLTATLVPDHENAFIQHIGLQRDMVKVIRAQTGRKELRYHNVHCRSKDDIEALVVKLTYECYQRQFVKPDSRIIIFCHSVANANAMGPLLGCLIYHSKLSPQERHDTQVAWTTGATAAHRCIAATSSFVHGIDAPFVDLIIFLNTPHGAVDFVQAAARGGRRGRPCMVVLVHHTEMLTVKAPDYSLHKVMNDYMVNNTKCRRRILSAAMDGVEKCCDRENGDELCDVCNPNTEMTKLIKWCSNGGAPHLSACLQHLPNSQGHPINVDDDDDAMYDGMDDSLFQQVEFTDDQVSYSLSSV
ncbi:uncharacterized protein B0H18DRAFT_879469 [Fomitopsis serialis]|uniref:uncharacterized protein n=1 Tax=Fomitopsis serialis TaxID=139415 RepID=UPI00200842CF|nr:uncharacterized protein B0H18DRAFT_879469 [Neoantrodia serialis]KAH9922438.1 hypothetical protein B0H18DRAFT_879469 [Neoantrodia serialis]